MADSLKNELDVGRHSEYQKARILDHLIFATTNPDEIIFYADELLELSGINDSFHVKSYQAKGGAYRFKGQLNQSLEWLFKSAELASRSNLQSLLAEAYLEIGSTYASNDDLKNSLLYDNKAINLFRQLDKQQELAINLLNTGYTYYSLGLYDSALLHYNEAAPIFDSLEFTIGQAYNQGNRALVFWKTGDLTRAKRDLLSTIETLTSLGDQYGISDYLNQLGNIYLEEGNDKKAIFHLTEGLEIAHELDLKEQISDANQKLSTLHEAQGNNDKALSHYKAFIAYRDSITNLNTVQQLADLRTEFEVNLREKEIDTLEQESNLQRLIAIILLVLSIVVILYFRQRFRTTKLMASVERKEHEDEIHDLLKSQETQALQSMVQGKEEERRHLARELHNHLGSLLATVKVNLNGMDNQEDQKMKRIIGLVDQATQDVRNLSHELHMGVSENFGLIPALQELTRHLQQNKNLSAGLSADLEAVQIEAQNEILIYRIVQELVSNVLKHAQASKLSISLTGFEDGNLVNIMVEDDGVGFDPQGLDKSKKGIGLDSLEDMIHKIDGEIHIDSGPNKGTTINVDIPFEIPENHIAP